MYVLYIAYEVFFHTRWGQTLGKMATGLKVVRLSFTPITFREAFLRSTVDIALALTEGLFIFGAAWKSGIHQDHSVTLKSIDIVLENSSMYHFIEGVIILWICSEIFTVLFNKKKRAIHDYIAGTVVVETEDVSIS